MIAFALLWSALGQEGEERSLLAEIERYDVQIGSLDAQIGTLSAEERARAEEIDRNEAEAVLASGQIGERRLETAVQVRRYYRLQRQGLVRLVFEAEDPWDLRRRIRYVLAVIRAQHVRQLAWGALVERRDRLRREGEAARATVATLQGDLAARRSALDGERRKRLDLLRKIRGVPELAAQANLEVRRAQDELSQSVRGREASVPLSVGGPEGAAFRAGRGTLPPPVRGSIVLPFGPSTDPVTGEVLNNVGIDIAAPLGTPFRSVFAGTVTRSGYSRGYGQMVTVEHGTYVTLYSHANGLRVAQGQEVQAGDVLGLVGTTGLVEDAPPRLHFEIRYNGTPQDPLPWLAR